MLVTMSLRLPHVVAFRCTDEEKALVDDLVASYPGMKQGTALREFFMNGEVIEVVRRRSSAYRARRALEARAALATLGGDDDAPDSTPSDPHPPLPTEGAPAPRSTP